MKVKHKRYELVNSKPVLGTSHLLSIFYDHQDKYFDVFWHQGDLIGNRPLYSDRDIDEVYGFRHAFKAGFEAAQQPDIV